MDKLARVIQARKTLLNRIEDMNVALEACSDQGITVTIAVDTLHTLKGIPLLSLRSTQSIDPISITH